MKSKGKHLTPKAFLSRRTFIRSGTALLALPTLEAMIPQAFGQTALTDPKRYVFIYLANGTYMKLNNGANWQPGTRAGALSAANLPVVFQPFASQVNDFSILRGVWNSAKFFATDNNGEYVNNHPGAMASYLTNTPIQNYQKATSGISGNSFDIEMAMKNNWKAYALSAKGGDWFIGGSQFPYHVTPTYKNGNPIADVWGNPYKLFTSQGLFMDAAPSTPQQPTTQPTLARNKSILDGAYRAIASLKEKVGAADKQRLDDYFTSLRSLEKTVTEMPPPMSGPVCNPANPVPTNLNNENPDGSGLDYAPRLKAFCDVIALAFKCNRAQIFSLVTQPEGNDRRLNGNVPASLNYKDSPVNRLITHNEIAHWDGGQNLVGEQNIINANISLDRFFVSFAMYLMAQLKASTDPSGSPILDNTIVELGHGMMEGSHGFDTYGQGPEVVSTQRYFNPQGMPLMIGGGRNMGFNPGNFHVFSDADLKDLHFTIASRMKSGLTSWRGSSRLLNV